MKKNNDDTTVSFSNLSADTLRGKQSVRVTFRLPAQIIALLSLTANQLGLQQKSLFDQLVEDKDILDKVAEEGQNYVSSHKERIQKTYVISRDSLAALKNIAKEYKIPRDLLVELSINRLRPVMDAERKKQRKWESLQTDLDDLMQHGQLTLKKAAKLLPEEDPLLQKTKELMTGLEKGYNEIFELIKKGKQVKK